MDFGAGSPGAACEPSTLLEGQQPHGLWPQHASFRRVPGGCEYREHVKKVRKSGKSLLR